MQLESPSQPRMRLLHKAQWILLLKRTTQLVSLILSWTTLNSIKGAKETKTNFSNEVNEPQIMSRTNENTEVGEKDFLKIKG